MIIGVDHVALSVSDLERSIKFYKKSIQLNNSFSISYSNLGASYFDKGDYEKAEKFHNSLKNNTFVNSWFFKSNSANRADFDFKKQ